MSKIYDVVVEAAKNYPILFDKNVSNGPLYVEEEKKALEDIATIVYDKCGILIGCKYK